MIGQIVDDLGAVGARLIPDAFVPKRIGLFGDLDADVRRHYDVDNGWLFWEIGQGRIGRIAIDGAARWVDCQHLEPLGFEVSIDPSSVLVGVVGSPDYGDGRGWIR